MTAKKASCPSYKPMHLKLHRPLTERERRLLVALSGYEQDRIIIDALDHQVLSMCSSIFS